MNVVTILAGSHLYGTATENSDRDLKRVVLPTRREILLGATKGVSRGGTKDPGDTRKNTAADTDVESFSVQRFLALASEGQTIATEMLFAPPQNVQDDNWVWDVIVANRHRLISRGVGAALGYCRRQAAKYGLKGSRVAAARAAADLFAVMVEEKRDSRLADKESVFAPLLDMEHIEVVDVELRGQSGRVVKHLSVCDRKVPFTASVVQAADVYGRLFKDYGLRSLAAERNEGVDWKAVGHAVRVGYQTLDLLNEGRMIFPARVAPLLLQIKRGEIPYRDVARAIETLLVMVEDASKKSTLPDKPDHAWIDAFVEEIHAKVVSHDIGLGLLDLVSITKVA